MFKKTITYLVLTSFVFCFSPLVARAESGSFDQNVFDLATDTDFSVVINAQDLEGINNVKVVLEYDPSIISYTNFVPGILMFPVSPLFTNANTFLIDENTEQLKITIATEGFFGSVSGSGELATIIFNTGITEGATNIKMVSITMYPADMDPFSINGDVANPIVVTVTAPDTIAPVRTNANPSGVLAYDTTETVVSINTDEDAVCHYSDVADTLFADSVEMTTTGSTSHSVLINGLSAGNLYNYYIRCSDIEGNINDDDYLVLFSTDIAPMPDPELSFSQTSYQNIDNNVEISLVLNASNLDEVNSAGFILEYNPEIITYTGYNPGALMDPVDMAFSPSATTSIGVDTEQLSVSIATVISNSVSGNGELATVNFRTNSSGGDTNVAIKSFSFYSDFSFVTINGANIPPAVINVATPDTIAPVRTNANPSGVLAYDTTETVVSINTDEDAVCHYSDVADTLFADSVEMTTTGSTSHSVLINGLSAGNLYNYYIRCSDIEGNINDDDYLVSFSMDQEPILEPEPTPETPSITNSNSGGSNDYIILLKKQKANSNASVSSDKKSTSTEIKDIEEKSDKNTSKEEIIVLGFSKYSDGTLVRTEDKKVYIVDKERLIYINSPEQLFKYAGQKIFNVTNDEIQGYQIQKYSNGDLIREKGNEKIYNIVDNKLKQILNLEELRHDFFGQEIYNLSQEEMALYSKK